MGDNTFGLGGFLLLGLLLGPTYPGGMKLLIHWGAVLRKEGLSSSVPKKRCYCLRSCDVQRTRLSAFHFSCVRLRTSL